ncbi:MAG: class I SAM-dependent methyltransferase [Rubricoccaceae bacterium]
MAGVALTARPPEAGPAYRAAFVGCALVACGAHVALVRQAVAAGVRWRLRHVLLVAVMLRALVLPLPPTLSDDGYRYLWDGFVTLRANVSPYALPPSDARLAFLRDEGQFDRLNSPHYHSVYPPVSQAVFAAGARAADTLGWRGGWLVLKLLVVLAELLGIVVLGRLAGAAWTIAYAWHPLAVIELAGQGHTEGLMVGALGLCVGAVWRHGASAVRRGVGGAALALAAGVKLYPVLLLPLLARRLGRSGVLWGAGLLGLLALPVLVHGRAVASSLVLYGGTFSFYALPHALLKTILWPVLGGAAGGGASGVLIGVWAVILVVVALTDDGSRRAAVAALIAVLAGQALLGSVLHPWYMVGALFVLPLLQSKKLQTATFAMSAGLIVSYLYYTADHTAAPWTMRTAMAVGWGGALAVLTPAMLQPVLRARARRKWATLASLGLRPEPTHTVLDLGCGEGYVAAACAEATGAHVVLADVAEFNRTARPLVRLDPADALPFRDGAFDAVLLVFVLHHAAHPERLIGEALRVSRGSVVVWESVTRGPLHRRLLEGTDRLANRLRSPRFRAMGPHLAMKPAAYWRTALRAAGAEILAERRFGVFHRQALYVVAPRQRA